MSDPNTNPSPTLEADTSPVSSAPTTPLPAKLDDVVETYFAPTDLTAAAPLLAKLGDLTAPVYNFDPSAPLPETHGLLVMPTSEERVVDGEKKRVTVGVVVAAVPTLEAVAGAPGGPAWLFGAAIAAYKAKLRNGIKAGTLPLSVESYITKVTREADPGLAAYKEIGPAMVKTLRDRGLVIDLRILRQACQSSQAAQAMLPNVAQVVWVKVISAMIATAAAKGLSTSTLDHWLATRDQVGTVAALDDIDL